MSVQKQQILKYYKDHGGDSGFKKLLSSESISHNPKILTLFYNTMSNNFNDKLYPFIQNNKFEQLIKQISGMSALPNGFNLNDIDERIKYLVDLFNKLENTLNKKTCSYDDEYRHALRMYIAKLLKICEESYNKISRNVSAQRMAGQKLEELHANFKLVEPLIKNDFEKILGSSMDKTGYHFSIKSTESIKSKIEMAQKKFFKNKGYSDLEACKRCVIDAIRYTVLYNIEVYKKEYDDAIQKLKFEGYKLIRCKNFWADSGTYNGLNCLFLTPYGYFVEVQFHTPESKKLNFDTHKLYEELRNIKTSDKRKKELEEKMKKLAENAANEKKFVDEIKKIKDFEISDIVWSMPLTPIRT